MSAIGGVRFAWLAYFAKPAADRRVYRVVRKRRVRSVVEVGIGSLDRAVQIIGACQRFAEGEPVRYAAVDWFEERSETLPPLSLIEAHRRLNATGARVRVSPGGPAAVEAVANALPGTDLILISPDVRDEQLSRAWYFLPRMCHAGTLILRGRASSDGPEGYEEIGAAALAERAKHAWPRRAA